MRRERLQPLVVALQAALVGIVVLWVLNVPAKLGIGLYTEQFLAACVGLALPLAFLTIPLAGVEAKRVAWHDLLAAALGFCACFYIALRYPILVTELVYRPIDGILVATIIVLLVLEATRRTSGLALVVIVLVLCLYALLGFLLPDRVATRPVALSRLMVYLGIDTNALLGAALQVVTIVVVPFVIMGQVLNRGGGADYFTDLAMATMGRYRGGAAKIAVAGSALFGMISGSAVANVAGVGAITIPLMKRSGFPAHIAGAIEAVGSTGGQLMPPVMGAAAFLMAEYLQVPYSEVMIAAALPAFLYYAALFIQVDLEAAKRGITGAPLERRPSLGRVLLDGWHFPIPFAILILGLVSWNLEPEYAALLSTAALVLFSLGFGYKGKRLSPKAAVIALVSAGGASLDMIVITAAAGLLIGVLNLTGLAFGLTLQLVAASGGSLAILLVATAAVGILLGMGMPTVGVYVILATLAAPALVQAGLAPMQAHMFVLYFGMMSMVTPPVALAAFAAANLAGADAWRTGWTATRVGWCAYIIPFLFAASPSLLLMGNPLDVTLSAVTALLGVLMGAAGVVGHLRLPLSAPIRVLFVAVGIALLVPVDAFAGAWLMNAGAFAAAALLLGREATVKGELASRSA